MNLHILLKNNRNEIFAGYEKYQTHNGELDILSDNGYVIATFAQGEWISVQRALSDGEFEWPDPEVEEESADRTGDSLLDGLPELSNDFTSKH